MGFVDVTLRMLLLGEDRSASRTLKGAGDQASRSATHMHKMGKAALIAGGALGTVAAAGGAAFLA